MTNATERLKEIEDLIKSHTIFSEDGISIGICQCRICDNSACESKGILLGMKLQECICPYCGTGFKHHRCEGMEK